VWNLLGVWTENMGSIGEIEAVSMSADKSKEGNKNKDVTQGTTEEGLSFWKKLKILLGCMVLSSKKEGTSSDENEQVEGM